MLVLLFIEGNTVNPVWYLKETDIEIYIGDLSLH